MPAKIIYCGCTSFLGNGTGAAFQDATYGKGHRVHSATAKEKVWRCTVCENEKNLTTKEDKEKAKAEVGAAAEKKGRQRKGR
jgi:hypothetical protein